MAEVVIGSRESRLAVLQSEQVLQHITRNHPGLDVRILTMKTTGDKILDRALDQIGGKGLFVKELDRALLDGRTQLSVHSLKDMPMEVPEELPVLAFSQREDPRDVLVLPYGKKELDPSKALGCSGKRRALQLRRLYPDMEIRGIRGNVQTRLKKLDSGEYAGLVLAAAGLKRLGLTERISHFFTIEEILPAAGQGILAVQGRRGLSYDYLEGFEDAQARVQALAERAFVRCLNGGCSAPVAAYAQCSGETFVLHGLYGEEKTGRLYRDCIEGSVKDPETAGIKLADKIKAAMQAGQKGAK